MSESALSIDVLSRSPSVSYVMGSIVNTQQSII